MLEPIQYSQMKGLWWGNSKFVEERIPTKRERGIQSISMRPNLLSDPDMCLSVFWEWEIKTKIGSGWKPEW